MPVQQLPPWRSPALPELQTEWFAPQACPPASGGPCRRSCRLPSALESGVAGSPTAADQSEPSQQCWTSSFFLVACGFYAGGASALTDGRATAHAASRRAPCKSFRKTNAPVLPYEPEYALSAPG